MEFLGSGGMYFPREFPKERKKTIREKKKKKRKKKKRGGGCQPFPNKFYGVQPLRTSSQGGNLFIFCDYNSPIVSHVNQLNIHIPTKRKSI